jgi:hypothetical protein
MRRLCPQNRQYYEYTHLVWAMECVSVSPACAHNPVQVSSIVPCNQDCNFRCKLSFSSLVSVYGIRRKQKVEKRQVQSSGSSASCSFLPSASLTHCSLQGTHMGVATLNSSSKEAYWNNNNNKSSCACRRWTQQPAVAAKMLVLQTERCVCLASAVRGHNRRC